VTDGFRTEEVGDSLNRKGIDVRGGHHYAQLILSRFGLESTVRATLALNNTCKYIDALVAELWDLRQGRGTGFAQMTIRYSRNGQSPLGDGPFYVRNIVIANDRFLGNDESTL